MSNNTKNVMLIPIVKYDIVYGIAYDIILWDSMRCRLWCRIRRHIRFDNFFNKYLLNNIINYLKNFENLSVEKKTLSTALGFEPKSFDCR